ncbi:MAG: hypothetical protein H6730_28325 [Deltaproteobacteria bacterium]|nr:hypothetical protein [Deltaproteobacteria bacterium]
MTMTPEVEQTIIHYYPQRALVSPLDNADISWDYDTDNRSLKALLVDLENLDPDLRPGTRCNYEISEELVLFEKVRLQLSYIGPFAALNYGLPQDLDEDGRERVRRLESMLAKHGFQILNDDTLDEVVPWIQQGTIQNATVWNCLFVHPDA